MYHFRCGCSKVLPTWPSWSKLGKVDSSWFVCLVAEVKCSLNISQSSPVGELSKAQHHELVTAIELDVVPVTFVAVDTLLELVFVEEKLSNHT